MKPGHGQSFVGLHDGEIGPIVSVTKLENGYTMIAIADHKGQHVARATVDGETAKAVADALKESARP